MIDDFFGDRLKERCNLRIRHDLVFVSCVLFTIALVCLIPPVWDHVLAGYGDLKGLPGMDRAYVRSDSEVGKLTLALVFIGLIVTWTGYLNKVRWTWFVMFILVFGLAIPLGIWPLVVRSGLVVEAVSDFILEAIGKKPATTPWVLWRSLFETISIFLLMVIALLLPVKSFFSRRRGPAM
jgi:hypothetical protein